MVCSTGWLTHWGQGMANTSAAQMTDTFNKILRYGNSTGSVNLYMAHGGTNFGFWAGAAVRPLQPTASVPDWPAVSPVGGVGAGLSGTDFLPQISSYDYSAPLSEQGRKGQPGIGGPNKYEVSGLLTA